MSKHKLQARTKEGGLRGLIVWAWSRETRFASAHALRGGILLAYDRLSPAKVSGLVVQVLVTINLGVRMGRWAGVLDSKCWLTFVRLRGTSL